jgi:hypothetical protein
MDVTSFHRIHASPPDVHQAGIGDEEEISGDPRMKHAGKTSKNRTIIPPQQGVGFGP